MRALSDKLVGGGFKMSGDMTYNGHKANNNGELLVKKVVAYIDQVSGGSSKGLLV